MTGEAAQPEFSRILDLTRLGKEGEERPIEATAEECAMLARRFGLVSLEGLRADVTVRPSGKRGSIETCARRSRRRRSSKAAIMSAHASSARFDLITQEIVLEDGVWIGARAIVTPGIRCGTHAILSVGGVATSDLKAWTVYAGTPAEAVKKRAIS